MSKPCFLGWLLPAKMKGGLKKSETPILWTFMVIYGHLGGSNVHKCPIKDIWEGSNVYKCPGQDMVIGMSGRYIRNCKPRLSFVSPQTLSIAGNGEDTEDAGIVTDEKNHNKP